VGALDEHIAADLIGVGKSVPRDVLFARLSARLRDNLAYTPEAALWAVETWAFALGILSESQLNERARVEAMNDKLNSSPIASGAEKLATEQPRTSEPPPKQPQPDSNTSYAPVRMPPPLPLQTPAPKPSSTITRPPATQTVKRQIHASRANLPATPSRQNNAPPQTVQPHAIQSQPSPRRGMTLRGCFLTLLILAVVIIAAIFIIPAIIVVLQEEQAQPSINEPRIK